MRKFLSALCSRILKDEHGATALEFALIGSIFLPVMIFGTVETSQILRVNMQFENSVSTFAHLVAANTNVTGTQLLDFCGGAKIMMAQWKNSSYSIAVASVTRSASGAPSMDWEVDYSCKGTNGSTATAIGAASATILANSSIPGVGDSALVVVGTYSFSTPTSKFFTNSIPLRQQVIVNPRGDGTITCTSC